MDSIKKGSMLIVDDDISILNMLQEVLAAENFSITAASSGKEALDKIKAGNFDFLLVDFILPDMSGNDVIRAAKAGNNDIFIVMMTGAADEQLVMEAQNLGSYLCLRKPFKIEEISKKINWLNDARLSKQYKRKFVDRGEKQAGVLTRLREEAADFIKTSSGKKAIAAAAFVFALLLFLIALDINNKYGTGQDNIVAAAVKKISRIF